MKSTISLTDYVKKRNGVALGAKGSMRNMLTRSLGAASFQQFWHYWNPIWGYYLSQYVMRPLRAWLPLTLAILLTFVVSGALHDVAVSIVKWRPVFFFTPWFFLMSVALIILQISQVRYPRLPWLLRAIANVCVVGLCLAATYALGF